MSVLRDCRRSAIILSLVIAFNAAAAQVCEDAKYPIIILPGIMASQINATYNGFAPGSPCLGHRSMTTVWPPSAKLILPTGLGCWMYMVQTKYNYRSKRFNNNRGVKLLVEPGGPSGTEYGLWQSSYTDLTSYLTHHFNYTLGKDMFGAPFDWRLHISGMERAGQMTALATKIESAVRRNCGKKAVIIGHSMGGLVALALLHRNQAWTDEYIGGFISVSAPYGGTSDQAIAVRMGSVDFNIADWVKLPMARAATDVATSHPEEVAVAVANMQADATSDQTPLDPDGVIAVPTDAETIEVPASSSSRMRLRKPGRKITSVAADGILDEIAVPRPPIVAAATAVKEGVVAVKDKVSTVAKSNMDRLISNYVSGIFYKATVGLPGLSMLLPYASAYGSNRRIVVTERETYTASMMQQLMADIGDTVTNRAWPLVHELEPLLAKGQVPGVPVHCIYAVGKDTTLTWDFPNIRENKPLLSSAPLVTTGGDGTVSMQSLRQCYKITDSANITELGNYGHLEVLKNNDTLAELGKALSAILYLKTPGHGDAAGQLSTTNSSSNVEPLSSSSIDSSVLALLQSSAADVVVIPAQQSYSDGTMGNETAAVSPAVQSVVPTKAAAGQAGPRALLLPATASTLLTNNSTETAGAVHNVLDNAQQKAAMAPDDGQKHIQQDNNGAVSNELEQKIGRTVSADLPPAMTVDAGGLQLNTTGAQLHYAAPVVDNNGSSALLQLHLLPVPINNDSSAVPEQPAAVTPGEASQQQHIVSMQEKLFNDPDLLHIAIDEGNISKISIDLSNTSATDAVVKGQSPESKSTGNDAASSHLAAWQSASNDAIEVMYSEQTSMNQSSSLVHLVSASISTSKSAGNSSLSSNYSNRSSSAVNSSISIISVNSSPDSGNTAIDKSIGDSDSNSPHRVAGSSAADNGTAGTTNQTSVNNSLSIGTVKPWLLNPAVRTTINSPAAATPISVAPDSEARLTDAQQLNKTAIYFSAAKADPAVEFRELPSMWMQDSTGGAIERASS